jgi:hypothetical protein
MDENVDNSPFIEDCLKPFIGNVTIPKETPIKVALVMFVGL